MSDAERPLIMLAHKMLAPLTKTLEGLGYRVALRWDLSDADRGEVRVILNVGDDTLTPEFLTRLPRLGLIANITVGYESVDVPWCRTHGIEVTNALPLHAGDVADHALGLLLAAWKGVVASDARVRSGGWMPGSNSPPRAALADCKLGIVGLGRIGEGVARRAEAFGMKVCWWGPNPKAVDWPRADSVLALARDSDILVITASPNPSNRGIVSREVIEAVGPNGLIVNVARGSMIVEQELIAALKDGRLGAAALDVYEEEPTPAAQWADVPNTVLTSHIAGETKGSSQRLVQQALENIALFLAGQPVRTPVVV